MAVAVERVQAQASVLPVDMKPEGVVKVEDPRHRLECLYREHNREFPEHLVDRLTPFFASAGQVLGVLRKREKEGDQDVATAYTNVKKETDGPEDIQVHEQKKFIYDECFRKPWVADISERHKRLLISTAFNITRVWQDAEDVVQNTLLNLLERDLGFWFPQSFEHERRFLIRVTINAGLDFRRQGKEVKNHEELKSDLSSKGFARYHSRSASAERVVLARLAIQEAAQGAPFAAWHAFGFKDREMAKRMSIPVATVKTRVSRERKQYKDNLLF